jgi:hypothetical protein
MTTHLYLMDVKSVALNEIYVETIFYKRLIHIYEARFIIIELISTKILRVGVSARKYNYDCLTLYI